MRPIPIPTQVVRYNDARTVLFDEQGGNWVGLTWNECDPDTWNERSAGLAIDALSQHSVPSDQCGAGGASGTGAAGTLDAAGNAIIQTPTGAAATGATGSLIATSTATTEATGNAATAEIGAMTAAGNCEAVLVSVSTLRGVGALIEIADGTFAVEGGEAVGTAGDGLFFNTSAFLAQTGTSATSEIGILVVESNVPDAFVGIPSSSGIGDLTVETQSLSFAIAGTSASGSGGTLASTGSAATTLTGAGGTGGAGTTDATISTVVAITAERGLSRAGDIVAKTGTNQTLDGIGRPTFTGTLVASGG